MFIELMDGLGVLGVFGGVCRGEGCGGVWVGLGSVGVRFVVLWVGVMGMGVLWVGVLREVLGVGVLWVMFGGVLGAPGGVLGVVCGGVMLCVGWHARHCQCGGIV